MSRRRGGWLLHLSLLALLLSLTLSYLSYYFVANLCDLVLVGLVHSVCRFPRKIRFDHLADNGTWRPWNSNNRQALLFKILPSLSTQKSTRYTTTTIIHYAPYNTTTEQRDLTLQMIEEREYIKTNTNFRIEQTSMTEKKLDRTSEQRSKRAIKKRRRKKRERRKKK